MPTVCLLYGFGEGPRVSRRFRKTLAKRNFVVIKDPVRADVLVTHSGGHLLVPNNIHARRILHIAPYYWPGRSWVSCMGRKLVDDIRAHHKENELLFWLRKSLWNTTYALRLPTNVRMLVRIIQNNPWPHGERSFVARPRYDSFCTPDPNLMKFKTPPAFVSLGNHHDDCWRHPGPYIDLLQKLIQSE